MSIARQSMSSRVVRSAGYDAATHVLEVEFQSGGIYQYDGVPPQTWDWFLRAPSKGDFVNNIIKPHYPFRNVTAAHAEPEPPEALSEALARSLDRLRR